MIAEITESAILDEGACRLREQHLPSMAGSHDPCRPMHIPADVPSRPPVAARPCASPAPRHPYLDTLRRPRGSVESLLRILGGRDPIPRAGEGDEERVPFRVDLVAVVPSEDFTQKPPVLLQHFGETLRSEPLQQPRRPLDVAEQERDRPRGLSRHGHMIGYEDQRYNSASVGLLEASPRRGWGHC